MNIRQELWLAAMIIAVVSVVLISSQEEQQNQRRYNPQYNKRIYDYFDEKHYDVSSPKDFSLGK